LLLQVHTFYEAVGLMISAQADQVIQDQLIERYMMLPNQVWDDIINSAAKVCEHGFSIGRSRRRKYRTCVYTFHDAPKIFVRDHVARFFCILEWTCSPTVFVPLDTEIMLKHPFDREKFDEGMFQQKTSTSVRVFFEIYLVSLFS
jgi:hypothetical protein